VKKIILSIFTVLLFTTAINISYAEDVEIVESKLLEEPIIDIQCIKEEELKICKMYDTPIQTMLFRKIEAPVPKSGTKPKVTIKPTATPKPIAKPKAKHTPKPTPKPTKTPAKKNHK
jgi:outer membrane biosynthesis protein TonB